LNAVQELQVLEIILLFFTKQNSDACRQSVFNLLFGTSTDNECKLSLLSKLVSVSVGVQNSAVLNSTAVWMQVKICEILSFITFLQHGVHLSHTDVGKLSLVRFLSRICYYCSQWASSIASVFLLISVGISGV